MTGLLALSSGSAAESVTFAEPAYRAHLTGVAYTGADAEASTGTGAAGSLASAGAVWVPEGTPRRRLLVLAPQLDALLARGGAVLLFGDQQAGWPASAHWTFRPAGGAGETRVSGSWSDTDVGAAAQWLHHHGVLTPPGDAELLLATPDGMAVAYLHRPPTGGALLVSTVDPLAHFGHTGAVESARFLDCLLPWVTQTLLPGEHR